jgi:hypothetical protein
VSLKNSYCLRPKKLKKQIWHEVCGNFRSKLKKDLNMIKNDYFLERLILLSLILSFSSMYTYAQVSGTVFRDFNANGTKDNTAPLNEVGLAGITVTAYNAAGNVVGSPAISAANGTYSITGVSGDLRIEFTGLQATDYSASSGGTSVQFVAAPATNVNYGVNYPADYAQPNPTVVVPTFVWGAAGGTFKDSSAIRAVPYNQRIWATSPPQALYTRVAKHADVGSVLGQAYNKQTGDRYFSAFLKRYVGFGPGNVGANGSPGAIYKINSSGAISVLLDLPAAEVGANPHPNTTTDFLRDPTWWEVGKMSWGDIDISDDGTQLFAMNLYNRKIYVINTANGSVAGSYPIPGITGGPAWTGPTSNNNLDLRPFALKYYRGKVYVGVVCTAESQHTAGSAGEFNGQNNAVRGFVFEFTPGANTYNTTPVTTVQLSGNPATYTYLNNVLIDIYSAPPYVQNWGYTTWYSQSYFTDPAGGNNTWIHPNLRDFSRVVISDIEFLNGNMIVGTMVKQRPSNCKTAVRVVAIQLL